MLERRRLSKPRPCEGCGQPADFAEVYDFDPDREEFPWHDLCGRRVDRFADAITAARDRRLATERGCPA
jgi:hypothetical protein